MFPAIEILHSDVQIVFRRSYIRKLLVLWKVSPATFFDFRIDDSVQIKDEFYPWGDMIFFSSGQSVPPSLYIRPINIVFGGNKTSYLNKVLSIWTTNVLLNFQSFTLHVPIFLTVHNKSWRVIIWSYVWDIYLYS